MGLKHRERKKPAEPGKDASQSREFNSLNLFHDAIDGGDTVSGASPSPTSAESGLNTRPPTFGTDQTQVVSAEYASEFLKKPKVGTDVAAAKTKSASRIELESHLTGVSMHDDPISTGVTRFTVVEESERRRSTLSEKVGDEPSFLGHYLSIGVIVALLLGSLSAIYIFTRPQSADQLYRQLSQAIESTNPDDLVDLEPTLEQFEELYPNDPRQSEFQSIKQDINQQKALRRLERRARISSVGSDLDPLEQAFLDSMKAREEDTDLAARKLRALLTVYCDPTRLTPRQQQLVQMAENVLEEIQKGIEQKTHPATEALNDQIAWAKSTLPSETQKTFFRSIIELYGDKSWAKVAVDQAKAFLEKTH